MSTNKTPRGEPALLLNNYLTSLRLPTFREHWPKMAEEAATQNLSYDRFLLALAEEEVRRREVNRRKRLIKSAKFESPAELADFDFSEIESPSKQQVLQLATGAYLQKAECILMVGNPGLGKTHLATSLGRMACEQSRKVRFYDAAALVNELILAQQEQTLTKMIGKMLKIDLLIIDELGFIPFDAAGSHLLFQLISALYERVSIIVTTNLRFADWTQVFLEERLTAALLDRLTHHAHILEFVGESYRFKHRKDLRANPMEANNPDGD